jgi:hypothetical protein
MGASQKRLELLVELSKSISIEYCIYKEQDIFILFSQLFISLHFLFMFTMYRNIYIYILIYIHVYVCVCFIYSSYVYVVGLVDGKLAFECSCCFTHRFAMACRHIFCVLLAMGEVRHDVNFC